MLVGFGPPPEESLHGLVFLECAHEVGHEVGLSVFRIGIGGGIVESGAGHGPLVAVACFHNHDGFALLLALQVGEHGVEGVQVVVVGGVVAQSDDVIVDVVVLHLTVETRGIAALAQFGVDDNPGIGAFLAASLRGTLEIAGKDLPGSSVLSAAGRPDMTCGPQHTIGNLIAYLDEVGSGSGCLHLFQALGGIVVEDGGQFACALAFPTVGQGLFAGVGPGVGIMEVEHQQESCLLDLLAQCLHIVEALHHTAFLVAVRGLGRVYEQAHAAAVPALALEEVEHVGDGLAVKVEILCTLGLIVGQERDIASEIRQVGLVEGDTVDVVGGEMLVADGDGLGGMLIRHGGCLLAVGGIDGTVRGGGVDGLGRDRQYGCEYGHEAEET